MSPPARTGIVNIENHFQNSGEYMKNAKGCQEVYWDEPAKRVKGDSG
jgi:hypothetical protein